MVILGAAASVAAVAWLYLVLGHGGFWRTTVRLPAVEPGDPPRWPEVVAVVPARDEAEILPETLPTLLGQRYPGPFRVVLVDDGSSDGTAEAAAKIAAAARAAAPAAVLRVIGASARPDGWSGKVWAMAEGARAAGRPEYLLFTDADIAYAPGTLATLVRAAVGDRRDLLSQMAVLRARTGWERALVPAFVYFFAQLYPFRRVGRPGRTAAAAGGCMLVRREALDAAGGLAGIRGALIDDVALARLLKRRVPGARCWLGLATGVVSRRAYPRLKDLWDMVARSAYTQLRYSPPLLAGTVAGLLLLYALPPAALAAGLAGLAAGAGTATPAAERAAAWAATAGAAGWALMAASYLPMLRYYRISTLRAPTLPAIAVLYAAMTVDSAFRHWRGRGGSWKGRTALTGRAAR